MDEPMIAAWDPRLTYQTNSRVAYAGRVWIARRWSCGETPGDSVSDSPAGFGEAWRTLGGPADVDKATMAGAIDERIGRGL